MPELKNPVYEKFAQLIASGALHKRDSFRIAREANPKAKPVTDKALSEMASRAAARDDVIARINELRLGGAGAFEALPELQAEVAERVAMTLEKAILEADAIQRAAIKAGQFGAAVAALTAKAKLAGIWIEKSESVSAHYAISDKPLTDDEWKAKYVNGNTTEH